MTYALDLLNSLSAADIAALTAQPDPEGHIIVGGDRNITIPSNLKRLGVQYDHNMETVTFDCPRYWDKRDMSKMAVYVNYMRSDGYADRYPVDNVTVDGEVMHFDWTISRNVTEVSGTVSFLVCVMKTDSEGNEERHWNSELCSDCYISKGMESEEHPALQYPDEVTQLLLRMATVEQINVQAEEMEQLLADTQEAAAIAEETKNQALDASGYIKNSYAPAIKGNVSGEVIRVDDVSPIEHDVKCWVHGKNLLNDSKFKIETQTKSGVTCTANADGSYTLSGTNTSSGFVTFRSSRSASYKDEPLIPSGTYTPTPGVTAVCRDEVTGNETNQQQTFDAINPFRVVGWYCYVSPNTDVMGGSYTKLPATIYPQLERGSIATMYEPYIDPSTVTVDGCGKNIFNPANYSVRRGNLVVEENSGNSYTVQGAVGTSTNSYSSGAITFMLPHVVPIKDTLTVSLYVTLKEQGAWSDAIRMWCIDRNESFKDYRTFNLTVGARTKLVASFDTSKIDSMAGLSFYINNNKLLIELGTLQVEYSDTDTSCEQYSGTTVTPSSDGTCTVTSVSPIMTLFTDTPGITIEAEYNRDTTKMFESYVLTDEAKNEIAGMVSDEMAEVLASLNSYATSLIGGGR